MAKVYRIAKVQRDNDTRRMIPVINPKTNKPEYTDRWGVRIVDHCGKRKRVILPYRGNDRKKAQEQADILENREREIARGLRPIPTPESKAGHRPFHDILDEYFAAGKLNGGRRGHPWSEKHEKDVRSIIPWWGQELKLNVIGDAVGCLPKVEKILSDTEKNGRPVIKPNRRSRRITRKTLKNLFSVLNAFFEWCLTRGYLSKNPVEGANSINSEPEVIRRCLSVEEILALFAVATFAQRTLLEVALLTGLRQDELRGLTVNHFDAVKRVLRIDPAADKGRKGRLQIVPDRLVDSLQQFIASGEARRLYDRYYSRKDCTAEVPDQPLLFVPSHTARMVKELAEKAGVAHLNNDGKIDFHAMRTTYVNHLIPITDAKTTQELARHEDANTTLKVYGRGNEERMRAAVNAIADSILVPIDEHGQEDDDEQ